MTGPQSDGASALMVEVHFAPGSNASLRLPRGSRLLEHLTLENSPVLFGCRAGMCGTCLIRVEAVGDDALDPPSASEVELLDIIACGEPRARLACQIVLTTDVRVTPAA
jgi:ferredoxin